MGLNPIETKYIYSVINNTYIELIKARIYPFKNPLGTKSVRNVKQPKKDSSVQSFYQ